MSLQFTDQSGRRTDRCFLCGKRFKDSYNESTPQNKVLVQQGLMQVCACGARGAYLEEKLYADEILQNVA